MVIDFEWFAKFAEKRSKPYSRGSAFQALQRFPGGVATIEDILDKESQAYNRGHTLVVFDTTDMIYLGQINDSP